ncbi:MAG: hypothetical protein KIT25_06885 [Enhydrobacter sp.]|nr:MAG: hypothetical protein KIT25_06885 [Enhydrobacter sp.]
MGWLLKLALLAMAVYGVWMTVRRWYRLFGGGAAPPPPAPRPPDSPPARQQPPPRGVVVEDTQPCPVCSAYISAASTRCGRGDCPLGRA